MVGFVVGLQLLLECTAACLLCFLPVDHCHSASLNALVKLSTILRSAVIDGLISRNPAEALQLPKRTKKEIDPFTLEEANQITTRLYEHPHWPSQIYAAFF
ncbi:hypothetical protein D3C81_1447590 [compost metagenome]